MHRGDLPPDDDALGLFDIGGAVRTFGDMHRATADQSAATGASA